MKTKCLIVAVAVLAVTGAIIAEPAELVNPFETEGQWYKANTHTHTTTSDGDMSLPAVVNMYRDIGYQVLVVTDHDLTNNQVEVDGLSDPNFLLLNGMESRHEASNTELIHLNLPEGMTFAANVGVQERINLTKAAGGEVIWAHPTCSSMSVNNLMAVDGYIAIEVYNAVCDIQGLGFASEQWAGLLNAGRILPAVAVDDFHTRTDTSKWYMLEPGQAWIMIKAPELTVAAIMDAFRTGCYYASAGPTIEDFRMENGIVILETSPVVETHLFETDLLGQKYVRAEVIDANGKHAWTNPIKIPIPDPNNCQAAIAQGYGDAKDINGDCYINQADFALLAEDWLNCLPFDANAPAPHIPVVSVADNLGLGTTWGAIIDDLGMSGDTQTTADTITNVAAGNLYGGGVFNTPISYIEFDLGQNFLLDEIWIWNYNHPNLEGNGWRWSDWKNIDIEISPEGGPYNTIANTVVGLADGTTANEVDLIVDGIGGIATRYIRFNTSALPDFNWGGFHNQSILLGEVRFYGNPEENPEQYACQQAIAQGDGDAGDINKDCCVNLIDLGLIAQGWLDCVDPNNPACDTPWQVTSAAHIPVVSVADNLAAGTSWGAIIDDLGMSDATKDATITNVAAGNLYGGGIFNTPISYITFDLGQNYLLDEIRIWNYNHPNLEGNGWRWSDWKNIDIQISPDAGPYNTIANTVVGLADGTTANEVDLVVDGIGGTPTRYIRFHTSALPDFNWGGFHNQSILLGEVRFYGDPENP
jgi:hypothetical protein